MTIRFAIVAAAALSCAACANQVSLKPMGLGFPGQIDTQYTPPSAGATSSAAVDWLGSSKSTHMKQTLGGKILSAIALERVTGRKPDPRRFNELH